ncbi:acyltransferase family protein [Kineosporia succinea]|uniref:Peptidoglycan/LPS O-acetylase OafA/YrhL n=1 Tax=Kineosporia succinea TaxID=84632 RepID=A0ABT9P423_9ACTN|nr:acyltransferase family protein [Kineosporia succinea]MDP9826820.1 peptidoglycan/LPS O-acetylase OafA/YrhL [Kineosporia succinea]
MSIGSIPAQGLRITPVDDVKPAPRPGFRPDIEGLRALAVLLVVLYHCGVSTFSGGYVGVDVFFVISGYLITSHLAREVAETGRLRIGRFYARRALRLLPAATLVLVATLVAAWIWMPPLRMRALATDAVAAAGYLINVRLIQVGNDYRSASASPSPLQHFWSLAVEEQFYLVIPLLALIGLVLLRRRAVFALLLGVLVTASFAGSVLTSQTSSVAAYFGTPTRAWELGAGSLLALVLPRFPPSFLRHVLRYGGFVGLSAIAYAAVSFGPTTPFPGWRAVIPVLGTVLVVAAGSNRLLARPALQFVGARSYSFYLWHWPALMIAPYLLGREIGTPEKLLVAVAAFGLACAGYSLIEQPLRHHPHLRTHVWSAAGLAVGLTALTVGLAALAPAVPARQTQGEGLATGLSLEGPPSQSYRALTRRLRAASVTTALPANLEPSLEDAAGDDPAIARDGCLVAVPDTTTPKRCEHLGAPDASTTVVLFGDSHAAQWYPALSRLAREKHWRLAVFTKVMCSPADVRLYADRYSGDYRTCTTWREHSVNRIRSLKADLVVTTSIADRLDLVAGLDDVDATWAQGWATTLNRLRHRGSRLVFLADTPRAKADVPECLSQNPKNVQACAQSPEQAALSPQRTLIAAAARRAGARVVDPTPWFCDDSSCPVVVGNTLIYRDDNHVTGRYARALAPLLGEELRQDLSSTSLP